MPSSSHIRAEPTSGTFGMRRPWWTNPKELREWLMLIGLVGAAVLGFAAAVKHITDKIDKQGDAVFALQETTKSLAGSAASLKEDIVKVRNEMASPSASVQELKARFEKRDERIDKLSGEISRLTGAVEGMSRRDKDK